MPKVRVLVVDDSVVIRRMLTDVLAADAALEVVGAAANGRIALAKLPQVNPDIVILDVEMPELGGLETLAAIRKGYPTLPVIMFSALTERGAAITLDALSLGATDYSTKPANVGSAAVAQERVREELIPKIKGLVGGREQAGAGGSRREQTGTVPAGGPSLPSAPARSRPLPSAPAVVAIGVSTGGPNALASLLPALPGDFPVPIVIVQHMPRLFTKLLADRLSAKSAIQVVEGAPGMIVEPGHAYIAPGDWHMILEPTAGGVQLSTHQGPPENSCRPAVDVLFRSCAAVYGAHVLAAVLTGMGQDGFRGAELIHEAGGQVLAQDAATSVVWGMPGYVAQAGLADRVLPLGEVATEILRRVDSQPRRPVTAPVGA
jgi:two-component system chemotaxis response regulator CheB